MTRTPSATASDELIEAFREASVGGPETKAEIHRRVVAGFDSNKLDLLGMALTSLPMSIARGMPSLTALPVITNQQYILVTDVMRTDRPDSDTISTHATAITCVRCTVS